MAHSDTIRSLLRRLSAAGGVTFSELDPGSAVFTWNTRLGRWPFEVQIDRWALQLRCYSGGELFCTGRIPEIEADALLATKAGAGDGAAMKELEEFVDSVIRGNSRRWLRPPHADRHPDRRSDDRQDRTIRALPGRSIEEPA